MAARIVIVALIVVALAAGAAMYWFQVYAFYEELSAEDIGEVTVQLDRGSSTAILPTTDLIAIDSDSSPIRFRACFRTATRADDLSGARSYPGAEPLVAPAWFDCFDAERIGAALEEGTAQAFLSIGNVEYGIDRVLALYPDGRGFMWHQINACGQSFFDGDPVPANCPEPPAPLP